MEAVAAAVEVIETEMIEIIRTETREEADRATGEIAIDRTIVEVAVVAEAVAAAEAPDEM